MRTKSETFEYFNKFHKYAEAHTGRKLKVLRTDNGGEYLSNDFEAYLSSTAPLTFFNMIIILQGVAPSPLALH